MNKKEKLKKDLLNTKCFIDCIYLDKYCTLIINNIKTKKVIKKTQRHHVIPVASYGPQLYKKRKNLILLANLDNKNYIVNLLYKDHILAHYYLCMSSKHIVFEKTFNTLRLLLSTDSGNHVKNNKNDIYKIIKELNLDSYQKLYQDYHKIDRSAKIICIETQKVGTINSFSKELNCYKGRLNACCKGINQTCRGYH